ncbi:MAG TPA: hypothetical protein VJZ51_01370, partial [Bacilli bacterium]|nr:hypothetical protein [Bacilli bacterium]
ALNNWGIITTEVTTTGEAIWSDGVNTVIKENENHYKVVSLNGWTYLLNNITDPQMISKNDSLVVVYHEERELYFLEINSSGIVLKKFLLLRDADVEINDFLYQGNSFYIVGGVANYDGTVLTNATNLALNDVLILEITENYQVTAHALGGAKNDQGLGLIIDGDNFILLFRKEPLTGGDFSASGIGDNILGIAILNNQRQVIKEITINDITKLQGYCLYDNLLCLIIDNQLCYLNSDLAIINKVNLTNTFDYLYIGKNGCLLLAGETKFYLLNLASGKIIGERDNEGYREGKFFATDKGIFCQGSDKNWLIDFYYEDGILTTLYGLTEMVEEKYSPPYDPQIYGKYCQTRRYISRSAIEFTVTKEIEIPLETNIMNGGVYPINYKLLFSGRGYINGNEILNNYALSEEGAVTIDLVGSAGEVNSYHIYVSRKQIAFSAEKYTAADFTVVAGAAFQLSYLIAGLDNIDKIVINDQEMTNFSYNNLTKKLVINLMAPLVYGNHPLVVNKIIYHTEDMTSLSYDLTEEYMVKVIKKDPFIELTNEEAVLHGNCLDSANTIRYFELVLTAKAKETVLSYPLANSEILLSQLELNQEYQATVNLVYDVGGAFYERKKLLNFAFVATNNNIPLGQIMINRYSSSLEKFSISFAPSFSKASLLKAQVADKIIFEKKATADNKLLWLGAVVIVATTATSYGFRFVKRRKDNLI